MKWTTSLILVSTFAGVAYAQQQGGPPPVFTPTQEFEANATYVKSLEDQNAILLKALLQQNARFDEEHKIRLATEKARDDALAKASTPDDKQKP